MSNQLTNDLITLIFNAGQIMREKAREKTNFKDCSFLHIQTLHFIKNQAGSAMKDIANYLHITPPSATSLVNLLITKGFVQRVTSETDRRTIRLQITKAGLELLKNNLQRVTSIVEKGINKLSDQEKKNFIIILNKISQ